MGFFSKFKEGKPKDSTDDLQEEQEMDINLNIGTSGVKSASRDLSKKFDHEKIRSEVNLPMIKRMIQILDKVETKTQFFTQLEDDEIPLITLVALGVTTEESINSYRTLRARGLDTYKADLTRTQRVDDEYENEVLSLKVNVPPLHLIGGGEIDEPLTTEELYRSEVKSRINLETKLREAENKLRRLEEKPEPEKPTYQQKVQQEVIDLDDMFDDVEEEEELDSGEQLTDSEYQGWSSKFEQMKDTILKDKQEQDTQEKLEESERITKESDVGDGKYQAVRSVHKVSENVAKDKEIYVLTEPFELEEELEGYKVVFIEDPNDLVLFTASKENLLVITREIPLQLVEMFLEWIYSVSSKGVKIRAVTLKGMEIEHAFIEGVIELTQESLDKYYEQNKLSKYIGTGVGTFFDIEDSIEGIL